MHKADQPDFIADLLDTDILTGEDSAEIDLSAPEADAATLGDGNDSVVERVVKLAESFPPPFCFSEAEIATKATFAWAGCASASARTSGPFRRPSSRSMRQLVSSVKRVATMDDANGSARLFPLACLDRSALLSLLRVTAQTAVLRLPARTLSPWPPDSACAGRRAR